MNIPDPKFLRLAAQRLRGVAALSDKVVATIPGTALLFDGDAEALDQVAAWLEEQAQLEERARHVVGGVRS